MSKLSFKYVIDRLKKIKRMMENLVEEDLNFFQKIIIYVDLGFCIFLYGSGVNDYFQYKFYERRHNSRKNFIVHRKRMNIIKKFNNPKDQEVFNTKSEFNEKYSEFIGRDWLLLQKSTFKDFKSFTDLHPRFIAKVVDGSHGKGIKLLDLNDRLKSLEEMYDELKKDNVIIEELIDQHEELAKFNPSSVNTLRVVTLLDKNDNVRVITANLRVGNGERFADNFHHNGIASLLDVGTGLVITSGIDMNLKRYYVHPYTGQQIIGFQIPYWNRVVKVCKEVARVTPSVGYVGWDVAIDKNGEIIVIEGNASADPDVSQIPDQIGKWPLYEEYF